MKSIVGLAVNSVKHTNMHSSHVCVVTRGKDVLAVTNNDEGNRVLGISVPSRHAEMNALSYLAKTSTRKKYYEKFGYLYNKSR